MHGPMYIKCINIYIKKHRYFVVASKEVNLEVNTENRAVDYPIQLK